MPTAFESSRKVTGPMTTGRAAMPSESASASSDKTLDGSSANVVDGEISGTR